MVNDTHFMEINTMTLQAFDNILAQKEFEILIKDRNPDTGVTKYSHLWVDYDEVDEKTGFGIGVWEYVKMRVSSVGLVDGIFTICVYSK